MLSITDGKEIDWANMPLDQIAYGNAMDTNFTLKIFDELKGQMSYAKNLYENLLKDVLVTFARMENRGLYVCTETLATYEKSSEKNLLKLNRELLQLLEGTEYEDVEVNFNSSPQVGNILFDGFGLPCLVKTKGGKPSITEDSIEATRKKVRGVKKYLKGVEFMDKMLEYKSASKIHRTYINGIKKALEYNEDGRIYSSYNIGEVVTGRLSCSKYSAGRTKPKGISFHTLPRFNPNSGLTNIRDIIKSDPGYLFLAADFSQAEVRMLAQCSRDENLIAAFEQDLDLHSFSASLIFQKDMDDVTSEERQIAKSVTFLIIYGGGEYKLHLDTGLSMRYCKEIFEKYKTAFPRVFSWIDEVHEFVKKNKVAISLFGRIRHLDNISSHTIKNQKRSLRQGTNFIIQSSTSDLMLFAIQRIQKVIDARGLDAHLLATVHDSIELQCRPEDAYEVLAILQESMPSTKDIEKLFGFKFLVPFEVDVEIGTSFGDLTKVEYPVGSCIPIATNEIDSMINICQKQRP